MKKHYFAKLLACSIACFLFDSSCMAAVVGGAQGLSSSVVESNIVDQQTGYMNDSGLQEKRSYLSKCSKRPNCCEGKRGHRGHRGHTGSTGPTGATGPTGPAFGNYASALNDGNTVTALSVPALSFNTPVIAGNVSYSGGVFTLNNTNSLVPAVYLVNVGYSSPGSEFDSGMFSIEVDINSTGLNTYANSIYGVNGGVGGGSATTLVFVPALGTARLLLQNNSTFIANEVSLTIVQIDNHGTPLI